jgi:leucyl aminopeptidase
VQIRVTADQPWDVAADVLVIPVVGDLEIVDRLAEIDRRSGGELRDLQAFGELSGRRFRAILAAAGDNAAGRLAIVLAGKRDDLDRQAVLRVGSAVERRLQARAVRSMAIWLTPLEAAAGMDAAEVAELVTRGVVEGSFEPKSLYRDDPAKLPPQVDELVLVTAGDPAAALAGAERGRIIGEGANWTRAISNRSAAEVSPEVLADEATALARKHGLDIDVIGPERAAQMGMNLFLAVGKGSDNPPRMIVMRSGGAAEKDALGRHLAIVGKGVCFDSGGISIKPADRMEEMKMDKIGACTVIGAIATVARLAPGTPLLAVAPAVENMPGGHASRPGDVVKAMNGKFVDINNTDAEGRLILADAMTYAEQLGATHLVDVATLTGAVSRALGDQMTGAFGQPQGFYDQVAAAGRKAAEHYWQLPLIDEYMTDMASWYGDFLNTAKTSDGGLVKSALFLREFATVPWVHLDIAGTGYLRRTTAWTARGATGVAHATLVELALQGARA